MGHLLLAAATTSYSSVDVSMLIFYFLLSLCVSFLCSLTEAGILSMPMSYAIQLMRNDKPHGRMLVDMKSSIDRPLAAILTLNTIAHTVGAAGVGAQAAKIFGDAWTAVVAAVLTLAILIFSEIIPKTWGAQSCRKLAPVTAYAIKGMIIFTFILVWPLEKLSSVLFPDAKGHHPTTREDVALAAQLGSAGGALEMHESQLIQNLLKLRDVTIKNVMTPRTVMAMLQKDMSAAAAIEQCTGNSFSRFPIYGDGPDDIVGVVLRRDIAEAIRTGQGNEPLSSFSRKIRAVPESAPVDNILWRFFSTRHHMFLVVDEYGGTAGIVTLEDAIETIFGEEIVDETDKVVDMQRYARTRKKTIDAARQTAAEASPGPESRRRAARNDESDPPATPPTTGA